jgi:Tn3 transposase DDE domain
MRVLTVHIISEVVFGLFWLLGYQFSPRLADIGEARFWRLDPTADYGVLNSIARARVNTKLITRNWDDLLRVAGSLHQGTVSASELMRSILRSKRPSTLARAIGAFGRIQVVLENSNVAQLASALYLLVHSLPQEDRYDTDDASARETYPILVPESTMCPVQSSRRRQHRASVVDKDAPAHRTTALYDMRPGVLGTGGHPDGPQQALGRHGHTAGAMSALGRL